MPSVVWDIGAAIGWMPGSAFENESGADSDCIGSGSDQHEFKIGFEADAAPIKNRRRFGQCREPGDHAPHFFNLPAWIDACAVAMGSADAGGDQQPVLLPIGKLVSNDV